MVDPLQALFFCHYVFSCFNRLREISFYPKVVGNSVGLPSIWVLAAVTIGGSFDGRCGDADLYSVSVGCIYAV